MHYNILNVTFREDIFRSEILCYSLNKFCNDDYTMHVVVNDDWEIFENNKLIFDKFPNVKYLHHSEFVDPWPTNITNYPNKNDGWITQQVVKCSFFKYCKTGYLIIDSKTIILQPIQLSDWAHWGGTTEMPWGDYNNASVVAVDAYKKQLNKPEIDPTKLGCLQGIPFWCPADAWNNYNFDNLYTDLFVLTPHGDGVRGIITPIEYALMAVLLGDEYTSKHHKQKPRGGYANKVKSLDVLKRHKIVGWKPEFWSIDGINVFYKLCLSRGLELEKINTVHRGDPCTEFKLVDNPSI